MGLITVMEPTIPECPWADAGSGLYFIPNSFESPAAKGGAILLFSRQENSKAGSQQSQTNLTSLPFT